MRGGGGDASPQPISDPAAARSLTGSEAPVETAADQAARASGILARTDSLIASTLIGETSNPDLRTFQVRTDCFRTRCLWTNSATGVSGSIDLDDLEIISGDSSAILSKNGITLVEERAERNEAYGAWMTHAGFWVQSERTTVEGVDVTARYGVAAGDLTRISPPVTDTTATWRGLMVGTPREGALRDNVLQGDATLTYAISGVGGGSLNAAFTDIKDIDRGAAHTTTSVRFADVPVAADGTWRGGLTGNLIQGGFYGPNHVEAAGVFEQSGIIGAFGARRQ